MIRTVVMASVLCLGCSPHSEQSSYKIDGEIDQSTVNDLYAATDGNPTEVTIRSEGGAAIAGLALAHQIYHRNHVLIVEDYCLSSCAEFVLPAASSVRAVDTPLIGFHQGPNVDRIVAEGITGEHDFSCLENLAARQIDVYGWNRRPMRIFDAQHDFLSPRNAEVRVVDYGEYECQEVFYDLASRMWFPTSQQLRELAGIQIEGEICADVAGCVEQRALQMFGPGVRITIGSEAYVTE